jgi:hypothetical protein
MALLLEALSPSGEGKGSEATKASHPNSLVTAGKRWRQIGSSHTVESSSSNEGKGEGLDSADPLSLSLPPTLRHVAIRITEGGGEDNWASDRKQPEKAFPEKLRTLLSLLEGDGGAGRGLRASGSVLVFVKSSKEGVRRVLLGLRDAGVTAELLTGKVM